MAEPCARCQEKQAWARQRCAPQLSWTCLQHTSLCSLSISPIPPSPQVPPVPLPPPWQPGAFIGAGEHKPPLSKDQYDLFTLLADTFNKGLKEVGGKHFREVLGPDSEPAREIAPPAAVAAAAAAAAAAATTGVG